MTALPANLPSVAGASLPAKYEAAKNALVECSNIDECMEWADKMAALASYAKQVDDDDLELHARRIRARAIRRCGELLKEIQPAHGANQNISGGAPTKVTRSTAAREAGLSRDQQVTAMRVANIPQRDFEEQIEAPTPPTITRLAEQGTRPAPVQQDTLKGRDPNDFRASTQGLGDLKYFAENCTKYDPAACVRGALPYQHDAIRKQIHAARNWLDRLSKELEAAHV